VKLKAEAESKKKLELEARLKAQADDMAGADNKAETKVKEQNEATTEVPHLIKGSFLGELWQKFLGK